MEGKNTDSKNTDFVYSLAVSMYSSLSAPFTLNRAPQSFILVHGDEGEDKAITRIIWSLIGSSGIKLLNTSSDQEVIDQSSDAMLTIIVLDGSQQEIETGSKIAQNRSMVGGRP